MSDGDVLLPFTVTEVLTLVSAFCVVAASLLGWTSLLDSFSRTARGFLLAFLAVELLVPAWVYYDVRRRGADDDGVWVHASVMPVVNLLAVIGYLAERNANAGTQPDRGAD